MSSPDSAVSVVAFHHSGVLQKVSRGAVGTLVQSMLDVQVPAWLLPNSGTKNVRLSKNLKHQKL